MGRKGPERRIGTLRNKAMKTLLKLVVIVTLLVIAVLVAVPLLFKEQIIAFVKDNVVARVEKQTGRRLSLTGDIGLSVFPWLGIDLGAASLGNAPGFEDKPFLQSQKLQLRLLPLLKKQLELDTVVIEGLVLNLYRNQSGKTNWEDLIPKDTPGERKGAPLALASLAVAGVKLADAEVHWEDRQQNTHYALRDLDLETGAFSMDKPIPLDLAFDLDAPAAGVNGRFSLNSQAKLNLEAQQYQLAPLDLQAHLKGRAIPEGRIDLALSLTGEADLKNQTAALTGLVLKGMGAEAKGEVHAREILGGAPVLEGNLALQAANLAPLLKTLQQKSFPVEARNLLLDARFSGSTQNIAVAPLNLKAALAGGPLSKKPADVTLATQGQLNLDKETLVLNSLALQGLGLDFKGTLRAGEVFSAPKVNGNLQLAPFNLRNLLSELEQKVPMTADPETLTQVAAEAAFSSSGNRLALTALNLSLDDSKIQGQLSVENFAKPAIKFDLDVDAIDLDRYLPPPKKGDKPKAATPGAAVGAAATLPVDTLRALNLKGRLRAGRLKIAQAKLNNITVQMDARRGSLKLIPTAQLYQGKYAGNIALDARGGQPRLNLNESLTGIQVGPLLQDLTGKAKLSGRGNFKAQLNAIGGNTEAIKKTLSGQGQLTFRDGAVKGVNLGRLIRKAKTGFIGPAEGELQTDFSELTGTFKIHQGVIHNDDLKAKSPLLRVGGEGSVNLVRERIDYTLDTAIVETSKGQGGKELEDLKGLTVPIRVTGTLDEPKFAPDFTAIAKAQAQEKFKKQREKVEKKLKKELGEEAGKEVGEKLEDLLNF